MNAEPPRELLVLVVLVVKAMAAVVIVVVEPPFSDTRLHSGELKKSCELIDVLASVYIASITERERESMCQVISVTI